MLSEERIEALTDEVMADLPSNLIPATSTVGHAIRNAIRRGYAEATAAERERLMEATCPKCGSAVLPPVLPVEPGWCWCHTCGKNTGFQARAEYLRLHPEAGEEGR